MGRFPLVLLVRIVLLLGLWCGGGLGGRIHHISQREGGGGGAREQRPGNDFFNGLECQSLNPNSVKRETFRSPPMRFRPGDVKNKFFDVQVPKGHIGKRDFFAEIVDENGVSVPLHEVYLHHWVMMGLAVPKKKKSAAEMTATVKEIMTKARNSHADDVVAPSHHHHHLGRRQHSRYATDDKGEDYIVLNFFGVGGETRGTLTRYPAPFAMEVGAPSSIPEGYERAWFLNVHGIDTRGAVNRMGCTECRCDLFNATTTERGDPLPEGYLGGLHCCTDERHCAVKEDFHGPERTLYLQYTWEYVEWDECVVPTSQFGIDVTSKDSGHGLIEYTVEGCGNANPESEDCVDTRDATVIAPVGGVLIILVSHLHSTALDSSLWGEDGRLLCHSPPIYGNGTEAGNEDGYVIGVVSCYPAPGSPASRIIQGERLHYQVKYSKVDGPHTGVMGLLGVQIVQDLPQKPNLLLLSLNHLTAFVSWISKSPVSLLTSLKESLGL
ncbi:unnamed protein product [Sphagnum compactum]